MNMTEYAKSLVKQYDKNGDNMLQPEEQKELRGRAAESDLNHDGVITIDELVAHLSSNAPATPAAATPTATTTVSSSSTTSGDSGGHHHHDGDDKSDKGKADADAAKRVLTGSAGGLAAGTKDGDKRHSYRFTPADERLPSGLPSWFKEKDKNGDGQIEMSEYARNWTNSTAAEFQRYDLNGDGIITAKEAASKPAPKGD
jgi:Ca2+-binding EF-hand superfamily protein